MCLFPAPTHNDKPKKTKKEPKVDWKKDDDSIYAKIREEIDELNQDLKNKSKQPNTTP